MSETRYYLLDVTNYHLESLAPSYVVVRTNYWYFGGERGHGIAYKDGESPWCFEMEKQGWYSPWKIHEHRHYELNRTELIAFVLAGHLELRALTFEIGKKPPA